MQKMGQGVKVYKGFFVLLAFFLALFLSFTEGYTQIPTASFWVNPASGTLGAPAQVQFTDTSTNSPTWWLWEFGDGQFSLEQHPLYTYQQAGTYTVTLSVGNVDGVDSATQSYTVNACVNPDQVILDGVGAKSSIQQAYNDAVLLGWNTIPISLKAGVFTEDLNFNADALVRLKGGYDCTFSSNDSLETIIVGSLTIGAGTVVPINLKIATVLPVANEYLCDGLDDNGNTQVDENLNAPPCFRQLGVCAGSVQECLGVLGWSGADSPECYNPVLYEVTEVTCDDLDNDCDGQVDEGFPDIDADGICDDIDTCTDVDGDTYCAEVDDCNDNDPNINPGITEICGDAIDNNCSGQADDTSIDNDGDGYTSLDSCMGTADDCDDDDPGVYPGATEIFGDGIDQDCNGSQDTIEAADQVCFGCHSIGTITLKHVVAPPDGTCVDCHAAPTTNVLSEHYGRTVRTAGNNLSVGQTIECRSCHDIHNDKYDVFEIPGTGEVWNPVDAIRPNETCDTCHEDRADGHVTGTAHNNRIINNLCGQCHTSDTTVLGQPGSGTLINDADVDALHRSDCTLCHNYTGTKLSKAVVRQAIQDGLYGTQITCGNCHSYHPDIDHTAIVTTTGTQCGNCHSDPPPLVDPADPKVHNACTSCHDANYGLISLAVGKSFSVGGNCSTCHGDFSNHSHHEGIYNDVSYNVVVDTSQTSQQGCALCHTDYDMINGSSLGLGTWETIFVEHDLDGTKDGSANSCDICHAYDGNSSPSLATVQNAIASGSPATCATCHTDKVPNVEHNIPTSGKHPEHLALPGYSCSTCHYTVNYPYFKSGTDLDGDNLYNLNETDVCENCHKALW